MKRKLTPMREFTLEMYEQLDCVHQYQDITYKYAKFLAQKPELWMFVGENAIFEGFELHFEYGKSWAVKGQGRVIRSFDLNTLEDLTHYNLTVKFEI
jgi:hypothetical protein